jgi:hypothetical protein
MVQTRNCGSAAVEDYFQRWQTLTAQWASYASNHFIGAATTWLEFYLQYHPQLVWSEFVSEVLARFSRN